MIIKNIKKQSGMLCIKYLQCKNLINLKMNYVKIATGNGSLKFPCKMMHEIFHSFQALIDLWLEILT